MFKAPSNFKTRPTQANFILDFIKDNPQLPDRSSKAIAKILPEFISKRNPDGKKIAYETVRARMSEFQKLGILENDDGQYNVAENWFKKLLKTGKTTDPKKETKAMIEIYTYENNDDDRYEALLNAALNGLLGDLDTIDNAGYTYESVSALDVEKQYVTDFGQNNPDGSWANLTVFDWKNMHTGRVELYDV